MARILMVSSYPYEKCGVSTYTGTLLENIELDIESFTIKLTQDGILVYLVKIFKLLKMIILGKNKIIHFQYTPTIMGPLYPALLFVAKIRRKTTVTTIHENMNVYAEKQKIILKKLLYVYERQVLGLSSSLVVLSETQNTYFINRYSKSFAKKITVIPIGINQYEVTIRKSKSIKQIGFFGFIKPGKGLELLAEALSLIATDIKNTRLIIAGQPNNDEYYKDLSEQYKTLDMSVQWLGYLSDGEMPTVMSQCYMIVLPYEKSTNSAILMDCVSAEVPVITTNVGSLKEIVNTNKLGYVSASHEAVEFGNLIKKLLLNTKAHADMVHNIQKFKSANSWHTIGEMHNKLYRKMHQYEL